MWISLPVQSHSPHPTHMWTAALLESSWECLSAAAALSLCCTHHLSAMSFYWHIMTFNSLQFPSYSPWLSENLRIKIRRYLLLVWLCHGSGCWSPASLRTRSRAGLWDFCMDKVALRQVFLGRYRSTDAPFVLIHLSLTLCNCNNWLHGVESLRSY